MTNLKERISFDEFDDLVNPRRNECEFDVIVDSAISRRGFMNVVAFGTSAFLVGMNPGGIRTAKASGRFAFDQIEANSNDTITVASGY